MESNEMGEDSDIKTYKLPKHEMIFHAIYPDDLNKLQRNLDVVINIMKKNLENATAKQSLFIKYDEFNLTNKDYQSLFEYSTEMPNEKKKYQYIFDFKNFIHYAKNEEDFKKITQIKKIDNDLLSKMLNSLKEKASIVLLLDFHYAKQITEALKVAIGENFTTKLFIKLYFILETPFLILLIIQKMSQSKTPIDIPNEKLLSYKFNEDSSLLKAISYKMSDISKIITYIYDLIQREQHFHSIHPGSIISFTIPENFYSDKMLYSITVIDSINQNLIEKKNCSAVLLEKNNTNDFLYLTRKGMLNLCNHLQSTRVMMFTPAPFNYEEVNETREKIKMYIEGFTFTDCVIKTIPMNLLYETIKEKFFVYETNKFNIMDCVSEKTKQTSRQLIYKSMPNSAKFEIKLVLTSKSKIKQEKNEQNYIQLKTIEKFSSKSLVSCFDDSNIMMFYERVTLSALMFLDLSMYPEKNLKILIIGAGIGLLNYYFDKITYSRCEIDAIEEDKELIKVGKDYFGTNQSVKGNIKWYCQKPKDFLLKQNNKDYYDMVIMGNNDIAKEDDIFPPPCYFEEETLMKIKSLLKAKGIYVVNLMSNYSQKFLDGFNALDKSFPLLFLLNSNDSLSKIHFCFKSNINKEDFEGLYKNNLEKLRKKNIADFGVIDANHESILGRVVDTEEFKKNLT